VATVIRHRDVERNLAGFGGEDRGGVRRSAGRSRFLWFLREGLLSEERRREDQEYSECGAHWLRFDFSACGDILV